MYVSVSLLQQNSLEWSMNNSDQRLSNNNIKHDRAKTEQHDEVKTTPKLNNKIQSFTAQHFTVFYPQLRSENTFLLSHVGPRVKTIRADSM